METSILSPEPVNKSEITIHKLHDKWTLWAHLPHDTDWTVKSYKKIMTFSTVEEALVLYETPPEKMIKNCMLFLMRDGIQPTWEDVKNRDGGCFSYKVGNKNITTTWKQASYLLVGESHGGNKIISVDKWNDHLSKKFLYYQNMAASCDYQNPQKITEVAGIVPQGCLFKKHNPQY